MNEIKKGEIRYYAHYYPVEFLSKNKKDYPNAIDKYRHNYKKTNRYISKAKYVYRILEDFKTGNKEFKRNEIVLLYSTLCFKLMF